MYPHANSPERPQVRLSDAARGLVNFDSYEQKASSGLTEHKCQAERVMRDASCVVKCHIGSGVRSRASLLYVIFYIESFIECP